MVVAVDGDLTLIIRSKVVFGAQRVPQTLRQPLSESLRASATHRLPVTTVCLKRQLWLKILLALELLGLLGTCYQDAAVSRLHAGRSTFLSFAICSSMLRVLRPGKSDNLIVMQARRMLAATRPRARKDRVAILISSYLSLTQEREKIKTPQSCLEERLVMENTLHVAITKRWNPILSID